MTELQLSLALDGVEEQLDYTMNRKVVLLGHKTVGCNASRKVNLSLRQSQRDTSRSWLKPSNTAKAAAPANSAGVTCRD